MVHTYTRERRVAGQRDPYGETSGWTYGAPESGIACYYRDTPVTGFDTSGNPVVVNQQKMLLRADDPLARGDRVSNIRDRKLNLIEAGPMYVRTSSSATPFGPGQYVEAYLQEQEGVG